MKSKIIKIICKFQFTKLTVEIPRILFINYWEVWGSTENAMKVAKARQLIYLEEPKLRRQFYNLNKDRFSLHDQIFSSVKVSHQYDDLDNIEYYLQYAVNHWLVEMENHRPEPLEMLVTEIRRARASPKVQVLKYARRKIKKEIKN